MDIAIGGLIASIVAFRIIGMTTGRQAAEPLDRKKFLGHMAVMVVMFLYCVVRAYFSFVSIEEPFREDRLRKLVRESESLLQADRAADASASASQALALAEKKYGRNDPRILPLLGLSTRCLSREKKHAEAEAVAQRGLALAVKEFGEDHETVAFQENNLGTVYADMGQLDRAEPLYRKALSKTERVTGQVPAVLPVVLENLADVCEHTDRAEEAQRLRERAQAYRPKR